MPHPSNRQHPSYGDCLEVKKEYYQNSSVLDCVTQCSQSAARLYEQFLQVKQIGLSQLDPDAVHRGDCPELYYCNMVEWFWWDSSLISTTNWFPSVLWHCWFGHLACKNRPRNDLLCVEWDVKHYTLTECSRANVMARNVCVYCCCVFSSWLNTCTSSVARPRRQRRRITNFIRLLVTSLRLLWKIKSTMSNGVWKSHANNNRCQALRRQRFYQRDLFKIFIMSLHVT